MKEYSYALITPYSLHKSRTGGIIGRILSHISLEFCAFKMFAPSDSMVDDYIKAVKQGSLSEHNKQLFCRYIDENLRANNPSKISNRCMLLVFKGENAASIIRRVIGHVTYKPKGDTVRGTFGDYITHGKSVIYFEPAVLCASDDNAVKAQLEVFKKYAETDGGVITKSLDSFIIDNNDNCNNDINDADNDINDADNDINDADNDANNKDKNKNQITLVMLKPDNFRKKSSRPGNIIDSFSKTGLFLVGAKLVPFSIAQAEDFYSPLKAILEIKLKPLIRKKVMNLLMPGLPFHVDEKDLDTIAKLLCKKYALYEFNRIIEYITGINPEMFPNADRSKSGKGKCLALLYYGVNAVSKIRDKLGTTDPLTAKIGTVRSEFGQDILRNGSHASDSIENAIRERRIIGLLGEEKSELDGIIRYD